MASAQVMPSNSAAAATKKKGHLELGRKKLEEFRKNKAKGRGKKVPSVGQLQQVEVDHDDKMSENNVNVGDNSNHDYNLFGTNIDQEERIVNFPHETAGGSSNDTLLKSHVLSDSNFAPSNHLSEYPANDEVSTSYGRSDFSELANGYYEHQKDVVNHNYYETPDYGSGDTSETGQPDPSSSNRRIQVDDHYLDRSSNMEVGSEEIQNFVSSSKSVHETSDFQFLSTSSDYLAGAKKDSLEIPSDSHVGYLNSHDLGSGVQQHTSVTSPRNKIPRFDGGRSVIADSISRHLNLDSSPWRLSEPSSDSVFKSSSFDKSFPYETTSGRSRSSFLDSLGIPRVSSTPVVTSNEAEKVDPALSNLKGWSTDSRIFPEQDVNTIQQFPVLEHPEHSTIEVAVGSSVAINDEKPHIKDLQNYHTGKDFDLPVVKKDEDFAALEQHIEDLTQEKYSLQRALDTSRALAESLAAENSSLTDNYNQQGEVVRQLRSELESLQQKINAHTMELESIKMEYVNAKLECNAADERAKVLASEVIGLEEKALRLRSNELKLEKELQKLNAEIASYKRKASSLEKERQDFQSTIDALQEEKKLLQSKLWKASSAGKATGSKTSNMCRRDMSTSTEDLGFEASNMMDGESSLEDAVSSTVLNSKDSGPSVLRSDNTSSLVFLNEEGRVLPDSTADIPHDQLKMIEDIRSLISELHVEKEELVQKLTIESFNNSKLKDLNKDLSQKLEVQTQRLELLTAQRMVNVNVMAKTTDTLVANDTAEEFTDEGDEVVERVLSWIMKLFPGGPSKRRTSKLL